MEVVRQLRLRDLGGVIVIDFVDMRADKHRRAVEDVLRKELKKDRARSKFLRTSRFGLIEMTRQRMRPSLERSSFMECPHCVGSGLIKTPESMSLDVMRQLSLAASQDDIAQIEVTVHPTVGHYVNNRKRRTLVRLEERTAKQIMVISDPNASQEAVEFHCQDIRGVPRSSIRANCRRSNASSSSRNCGRKSSQRSPRRRQKSPPNRPKKTRAPPRPTRTRPSSKPRRRRRANRGAGAARKRPRRRRPPPTGTARSPSRRVRNPPRRPTRTRPRRTSPKKEPRPGKAGPGADAGRRRARQPAPTPTTNRPPPKTTDRERGSPPRHAARGVRRGAAWSPGVGAATSAAGL